VASTPTIRSGVVLLYVLCCSTCGWAETPEEVLKEMRPSTGIEAEASSIWSWLPWVLMSVGIGMAGVGAGAALAMRLRRRTGSSRELSPRQVALQELKRLEAAGLRQQGEMARYVTELSNIVRAYLEKSLAIAVTRQTTPEFLESLKTSASLTPTQQGLLREFLEKCDLAKFAGAAPTPEQGEELGRAARGFIEQFNVHTQRAS